jgi:folylpolyglutamate synthase/dihydropteroate synthase
MSSLEPRPDEIAALLQVEHLLDQRWPETKLEPSTARISALMELLGSPQLSYPSIHIAGTNGKTSVARIVDALLSAFSRRTGRTTSPHLQSAVERIAIDNQPISPARYVEVYREIEPFVQMIDRQSEAGGGPAMSKFEVVTAMAFAAFADAPVDVAVVEVGMGGRWDATNVVDAPVAVITPIGIDHAEYLGHTIADIAAEKAGIIGAPRGDLVPVDTVAVIGRQAPEAMEVLMAQAVRSDAAVAREDSEFDFRFLVGVLSVMGDKDVTGILTALEPVFDQVVVTHNGSPRALEVDALAVRAEEIFGPDRVVRAETLPDAIETATAILEDSAADDGFSGAGIVITGSVVTAGAARTLFGKDPQ